MNDDAELLRRYGEEGAHEAFAELVGRHVNLVYSAALRQLNGDAHLAADATQLVFTDLARKATAVAGHRMLAAWLFTSTRFVTAKLIRGERRRRAREQESQLMHDLTQDDSPPPLDWQRARPVLDEVMSRLSASDREVILLRFFEGRDFASVGAKLNLAANTARMRVDRALDKLRILLERRGVKSTSAALAAALANQAVIAAPAGLAATVTGAALAGGAVAGGALAGGALAAGTAAGVAWNGAGAAATFMSITKMQMGLAGACAIAGATGYVIQAKTAADLRDERVTLTQQSEEVARLQTENADLARLAAERADLRRDREALATLQTEADALKTQVRARAVARAWTLASPAAVAARAAAFDGPVVEVSKVDQAPIAKFQARPSYPFEMRRAGTSGEVVVDFVVDSVGEVQHAFALRSSRPEFEAAAVQAVTKWKFLPGQKGGRTVNTHMQVPIVFSLDQKSGAAQPAPTPAAPTPPPAPWF